MLMQLAKRAFQHLNQLRNSEERKGHRSRNRKPKPRTLRLESLETRELLSISTAEFNSIRSSYPELGLPAYGSAAYSNLKVVELTTPSLSKLQDAIATARSTSGDDLIVVRTTSSNSTISFNKETDELNLGTQWVPPKGSITIVALGNKPLTIKANQKCRVMEAHGNIALANVEITGGKTDNMGGGLYYTGGGKLILTHSVITKNNTYGTIQAEGGGLYCEGGVAELYNCRITDNSSNELGGGVYFAKNTATLTNCLIAENKAINGGGVCIGSGFRNAGDGSTRATFINCTIAHNTASGSSSGTATYIARGGGVYVRQNAGTAQFYNTIIAKNSRSDIDWEYANGKKGEAYNTISSYSSWAKGSANIALKSSDPLFKDSTYTLAQDSVAIDKGGNAYAKGSDLAGNTRIKNNVVDIGAFEYQMLSSPTLLEPDSTDSTITVKWKAVSNASGYTLEYKKSNATLWKPASSSIKSSDTEYTIKELEPVTTYNIRILAKGDGVANNSKYSFIDYKTKAKSEVPSTVVTTINDVVDSTDGLISLREAITVYASNGATVTFSSALHGKTLTLKSELLVEKSITIDGGSNNITVSGGNAVRVIKVAGSDSATYTIKNLTITKGNDTHGSGVYVASGSANIINCTITGNKSSTSGGGVYVAANGALNATNLLIVNNTSKYGGGLYTYGGTGKSVILTNCTIANNKATKSGSGIHFESGNGTVEIRNSIIVLNTGSSNVYKKTSSRVVRANNTLSTFSGWSTGSSNNLVYASSSPLFYSVNYTLAQNSQAINKGSNVYVNGISTDLNGKTRIVGEKVDLGAYEFQGEVTPAPTPGPAPTPTPEPDPTPTPTPTKKLSSPTFTKVAKEETALTVNWNMIANTSSYTVRYKRSNESTWKSVKDIAASKTSYKITGLKSGLDYTVQIRAVGDGSNFISSSFSKALYTSTTKKLTAPKNLKSTATTKDTITVSWSTVKNASSYTIQYKKASDSSFTTIKNISKDATSYALKNLATGTKYEIKIRAIGDGSDYSASDFSGLITVSTKKAAQTLAAPTLKQGAKEETALTVNWNKVANASSYTIRYKRSNESTWTTVKDVAASKTSYKITGLKSGLDYTVQIRAVGDGSNYISSSFSVALYTSTTKKLTAPKNLKSTATTKDTITVSWSTVKNVSSYTIQYKKDSDSSFTSVKSISKDTTSFSLKNLTAGTKYEIKIRAIGDGNNYSASDFSGLIIVSTKKAAQNLGSPTLKQGAKEETALTVNWNKIDHASSYTIRYKRSNESTWTTVKDIAASKTSYKITGLKAGLDYTVQVRAVGDGSNWINSPFSNALNTFTTKKLASTKLTAGSKTANSITVSWSGVKNASSYTIQYKKSSESNFTTVKDISKDATSYTLKNLTAGTKYEIKIRAVGDGSNYKASDFSGLITMQTSAVRKLGTPTISLGAKTANSIVVKWTKVDGASSYTLQYKKASDTNFKSVSISADKTSYTVPNLASNTKYQFKIRARGDGGVTTTAGDFSSIASGLTIAKKSQAMALSNAVWDNDGEQEQGNGSAFDEMSRNAQLINEACTDDSLVLIAKNHKTTNGSRSTASRSPNVIDEVFAEFIDDVFDEIV